MKAKTLITGALCLSAGAIVGREFGRIQFAKQLLDKLENEKDALEKLKEQESIKKESEDNSFKENKNEDESDELESDDEETDDDEDVPYIFVIRAHSSNEGESL